MIYSVAQVLLDARNEEPKITDIQAFAFFDKVHRFLAQNYILKTQIFQIPLVALVGTYPLDTTVTMVRNAIFMQDSLTPYGLDPVQSIDWDVDNPTWRKSQAAQPTQFSFEEGNMILDPMPPTSSDGTGYPLVEVSAAVMLTLTRGSNLPPDIHPDVYIEGIKAYWAKSNAKDLFQLYWSTFQEELTVLNNKLPTLSVHYRKQITPQNTFTSYI